MQKLFNNRGYTLLFAILTTALVLGVGLFILNSSRKQFLLAVTARNSTSAFYSADSGIECATLAYDSGQFSTSSPAVLNCNGQTVQSNWSVITPSDQKGLDIDGTGFQGSVYLTQLGSLAINLPNGACVQVRVIEGIDNTDGTFKTLIESRGYNLSNATNCPLQSIQSLERAIIIIYH